MICRRVPGSGTAQGFFSEMVSNFFQSCDLTTNRMTVTAHIGGSQADQFSGYRLDFWRILETAIGHCDRSGSGKNR